MKNVLMTLLLSVTLPCALIAQTTPALPGAPVTAAPAGGTSNTVTSFSAGYEGLPWGATIQQVLQKYPSLWYSPETDKDFPNSKKGVVKSSSGAVKQREFVFVDGKLVKVIVSYDPEAVNVKGLLDESLNRFGKPDDYEDEDQMILGTKAKVVTVKWDNSDARIYFRGIEVVGNTTIMMLYMSKAGALSYAATKQSVEF